MVRRLPGFYLLAFHEVRNKTEKNSSNKYSKSHSDRHHEQDTCKPTLTSRAQLFTRDVTTEVLEHVSLLTVRKGCDVFLRVVGVNKWSGAVSHLTHPSTCHTTEEPCRLRGVTTDG